MAMKRANKIAKMEGKKVQVSIGNVREVLARETDLIADEVAGYGPVISLDASAAYREFVAEIEKKVDKILAKTQKAKK